MLQHDLAPVEMHVWALQISLSAAVKVTWPSSDRKSEKGNTTPTRGRVVSNVCWSHCVQGAVCLVELVIAILFENSFQSNPRSKGNWPFIYTRAIPGVVSQMPSPHVLGFQSRPRNSTQAGVPRPRLFQEPKRSWRHAGNSETSGTKASKASGLKHVPSHPRNKKQAADSGCDGVGAGSSSCGTMWELVARVAATLH